jgi:hypothetical protein
VNACDEITDEDAGKEGSLNINNFWKTSNCSNWQKCKRTVYQM